jgi:hypothetical protein
VGRCGDSDRRRWYAGDPSAIQLAAATTVEALLRGRSRGNQAAADADDGGCPRQARLHFQKLGVPCDGVAHVGESWGHLAGAPPRPPRATGRDGGDGGERIARQSS